LLDAPHMGVDGLGQPEDPVQLGDEDTPAAGVRLGSSRPTFTGLRPWRIVFTRRVPFVRGIWLVSQPQFSRNERSLSRIERTYVRLTHGSSSDRRPGGRRDQALRWWRSLTSPDSRRSRTWWRVRPSSA
jgi:hypothetical protein